MRRADVSGSAPSEAGYGRPYLSVITASRHRHALLRRKAISLKEQSLPAGEFEWRIWLNEPPAEVEAVRAVLARLRLPFEYHVDGGEALPVGAARNRAAAAARGEVLLLSDDDCLLAPEALAAHVRVHRRSAARGREVAAIGRLRLNEELRKGRRAEPFERPARLGPFASWINFTGANSSLPAQAFGRVGGYDEQWEGYGGEDPELALRLLAAGVSFRHVPAALATHEGRVWDDATKAYRAGRAHQRVVRRHGRGAWALGVHPLLLGVKRVALHGPWSGLADGDVLAYERAYARGARDEIAGTAAGPADSRAGKTRATPVKYERGSR